MARVARGYKAVETDLKSSVGGRPRADKSGQRPKAKAASETTQTRRDGGADRRRPVERDRKVDQLLAFDRSAVSARKLPAQRGLRPHSPAKSDHLLSSDSTAIELAPGELPDLRLTIHHGQGKRPD